MNESAGDQVAEMLGPHLDLIEETPDSPDDIAPEDVAAEAEPVARVREGLPRSFRMRHDAHYVDELMSRSADSGRERDVAPPRTSMPPAAPAERADPVAYRPSTTPAPPVGLIADRLEAIVAHANASRSQIAGLIDQAVHVELARVTRLARAAATLQSREAPVRESVFAHQIADGVSGAAAPVARMAGMEFDVSIDDRVFEIAIEPTPVVQAIAGTVDAVVELLLANPRRQTAARQGAGRIAISLQSVKVRPALIVDIFCPTLALTAAQGERFFRNADEDYRSAPAAGVLLAAAAQTVRAHGGRADIKQHPAGVTITYVYPHNA